MAPSENTYHHEKLKKNGIDTIDQMTNQMCPKGKKGSQILNTYAMKKRVNLLCGWLLK